MRRLCRFKTALVLLTGLACGCGSSVGDPAVLRFERFDNTGITQADSVRENSADVDVEGNLCLSGGTITPEPFTQTVINATFTNEEKSDIRLNRYRLFLPKIGNADSGLGDFLEFSVSANIPGGRCSNADIRCAVDADCSAAGGGISTANCLHGETTVHSLLLFDFLTKALLDKPNFLGIAANMTITFFGSDDAEREFETSASYVVTFDDFNNCPSSSGGGAGSS